MPRVIVTATAVRGLDRCRAFFASQNRRSPVRAATTIERHFALLETTPETGRPFSPLPDLGELIIAFGDSGYVALYRYVPASDIVYVLAFRHQKEVGY